MGECLPRSHAWGSAISLGRGAASHAPSCWHLSGSQGRLLPHGFFSLADEERDPGCLLDGCTDRTVAMAHTRPRWEQEPQRVGASPTTCQPQSRGLAMPAAGLPGTEIRDELRYSVPAGRSWPTCPTSPGSTGVSAPWRGSRSSEPFSHQHGAAFPLGGYPGPSLSALAGGQSMPAGSTALLGLGCFQETATDGDGAVASGH